MNYAVTNRLSYKAISDLLDLIKVSKLYIFSILQLIIQLNHNRYIVLRRMNAPPTSTNFENTSNNSQRTLHIIIVLVVLNNFKTCTKTKCIRSKAKSCDLVLLPIDDCLKQLYGKYTHSYLIIHYYYSDYVSISIVEEHDHFSYPSARSCDEETMRDIHDGTAFKALSSNGGFLSKAENIGLIISSDDVPVFKSSKGSIWPVYLMVTNIPPYLRTKVDHLIVAALWYGPIKPDMNVILKPILEKIASLNEKGIPHKSGVVLRPKLQMGVFDLPAISAVTNTKQFNGKHGCFYCLDEGEVYNRARIYPPSDKHILRTTDDMRRWASKAERTGQVQYGVKGRSILGEHIEYPQCIPVDYMHSVLEGTFKNLMRFWFDAKYHAQPYNLRKSMNIINKLLSLVKPTDQIRRPP